MMKRIVSLLLVVSLLMVFGVPSVAQVVLTGENTSTEPPIEEEPNGVVTYGLGRPSQSVDISDDTMTFSV
jgi:hypothetical protein